MQLLEQYCNLKRSVGKIDLQYRREGLFRLNLAYAKMLQEEGFLNSDEYELIVKGLKAIQNKVSDADVDATEHGDIWFVFEKALTKEIDPAVAAKLHLGRSRNDMYFSMYRISLREALWRIIQAILDTQKILETAIEKNIKTVIPYYTYGQPSQPGTWGHYLLGVHEMLGADLERFKRAYANVNRSAMGSAAGIGTSFALNKKRVSDLLGFDSVIEHTNVSICAVDYFLETISDCAILNTTLSRVASDMVFLSSAECGILDFEFTVCESSSIMPQKKNAQAAELLRAETEHLWGYLMTAFSSASSTTFFPTHETFLFFDTFWQHVNALVNNVALLALNIQESHIRESVALKRALDGFTAATAMAEQLTQETNIPFTRTHHVVGGMIRHLMDTNKLDVKNMTPALLEEQSLKHLNVKINRSEEEIQAMLDPLHSLNAKVTGGTPKPSDTEKMLKDAIAARQAYEAWFLSAKKKVESAYGQLS